MNRVFLLGVLTVAFGACLPSGGGGGGDCREADDACSDGFVCVAVGGGSTYDCRAECFDDDECLREEQCSPDGICVDREGPPPDEEDARVVVIDPPAPIDMSVPDDAEVIRILDGSPDPEDAAPVDAGPASDRGVVVVPEPGQCGSERMPAPLTLLAVELEVFAGFPLYLLVENLREDAADRTLDVAVSVVAVENGRIEDAYPAWEGEIALGDDGEMVLDTEVYVFPPDTNQLGGELVIDLTFEMRLRVDGTLCGAVSGGILSPIEQPVDGVVAGRPFDDPNDVELDPFRACDGCLP